MSESPVDLVLGRLDGVKQTGPGRWGSLDVLADDDRDRLHTAVRRLNAAEREVANV